MCSTLAQLLAQGDAYIIIDQTKVLSFCKTQTRVTCDTVYAVLMPSTGLRRLRSYNRINSVRLRARDFRVNF